MDASPITLEQAQDLRSQLADSAIVLLPDSDGYDDSLKKWSTIGCQRSGVTVRPKNAQSIAKAVLFASHHKIDLAVKGGGHSTDTSSSTDGGILIDLSSMKEISVDESSKQIAVQGGALWEDVYQVTSQHGLAVVGATISCTGVGGLTLRGGYGYLTPQHGLVIDNLVEAQVVTADGSILTASAQQNPDLFWAVRGAGQNVGVVTELVFQAYDQKHMAWSGTRVYGSDKLSEIHQALDAALVHPHGKAAAQCLYSLSPQPGNPPVVTIVLFFDGPEKEARSHFSRLLSIECVTDDMRMRDYAEANSMLNAGVPPGGRKVILGVQWVSPVRLEFASAVMEEISCRLAAETDMSQSVLVIDYFDQKQACCTPVEATAFPARRDTLNGALILQWTDQEKDKDVLSWGQKIQMMCEDELRRSGRTPDKLVSNFLGYTAGDSVSAADMFGTNTSRLLEIKKIYDPQNLFNKLNPLNSGTK
ncbi:hypothetical protein HFD88_000842 [Aspergillus terreus]|nr:hypothetical protein HFD88_000842 [Aspergillus terreus]